MIRPAFLWLIAASVLLLAVVWGRAALAASSARVDDAARLTAETRHQVERLAALQAAAPRLEVSERPPQDLIARVHAVLGVAGLPGSLLQEVTPQADVAAAAGSSLRRQSVLVRLRPASPRDLGAFLAAWETEQPAWVPTAAEWTHRASGDTTNRFELALTVTATYRSDDAH